MKKLIAVIVALCFACGAPSEDLFDAHHVGGEQLGQVEQPYTFLNTNTYQWGVNRSVGTLPKCNKTNPAQVCTIPQYVGLDVAYNPNSWTAAEQATIATAVQGLAATYPDFDVTLVNVNNPPTVGKVRVAVAQGTVGGSLLNDITGYRSVQFFSNIALTEGQHAGAASPVGSYFRHGSCALTIDMNDINAKGATANQRAYLLDHALGQGGQICMGLGTVPTATGYWSQTPIKLTGRLGTGSFAEDCQLQNIGDTGDQADVSRITQSACAGD